MNGDATNGEFALKGEGRDEELELAAGGEGEGETTNCGNEGPRC